MNENHLFLKGHENDNSFPTKKPCQHFFPPFCPFSFPRTLPLSLIHPYSIQATRGPFGCDKSRDEGRSDVRQRRNVTFYRVLDQALQASIRCRHAVKRLGWSIPTFINFGLACVDIVKPSMAFI